MDVVDAVDTSPVFSSGSVFVSGSGPVWVSVVARSAETCPTGTEASFDVSFGPYSPGRVSRVSSFELRPLRKLAIGELEWARKGCTTVCRIA